MRPAAASLISLVVRAFKRLHHRSPIGFFVLVTLLFCSLTFLIQQSIVLKSRSRKWSRSAAAPSSTESFELTTRHQLQQQQQQQPRREPDIALDLHVCREMVLADERAELADLRLMKQSYLKELREIETRRRSLLRHLQQLSTRIKHHTDNVTRLEARSDHLQRHILATVIRISDHHHYQYSHLDEMLLTNASQHIAEVEQQQQDANDELPSNDQRTNVNGYECLEKASSVGGGRLKVLIWAAELKTRALWHWAEQPSVRHWSSSLSTLNITVSDSKTNLTTSDACVLLLPLFEHSPAEYAQISQLALDHHEQLKRRVVLLLDVASRVDVMDTRPPTSLIDHIVKRTASSSMTNMTSRREVDMVTRLLADVIVASFRSSFGHHHRSDRFVHFSLLLLNSSSISSLTRVNKRRRHFLISYHQSHDEKRSPVFDHLVAEMSRLPDPLRVDINANCSTRSSERREEDSLCYDRETRASQLLNATFTFLPPAVDKRYTWTNELTHRLIEALRCGTIPVLVDTWASSLPLGNLIAWHEVVVRTSTRRLSTGGAVSSLLAMSESDTMARQIRARSIYAAYFASRERQLETLLATVRHHLDILPPPSPPVVVVDAPTPFVDDNTTSSRAVVDDAKNATTTTTDEYLGETNPTPVASASYARNMTRDEHAAWNRIYHPFHMFPALPYDEPLDANRYEHITSRLVVADGATPVKDLTSNLTIGGADGSFFHYSLGGNCRDEQFTIVILSYKRESMLVASLLRYVRLPHLHTIVVVWNTLDKEPSAAFARQLGAFVSSGRIRVVRSRANTLNARFLPYECIRTDAVLSLDDDVSLRDDEIMFAFRVWRENRERIVGFPARYHAWSPALDNYVYRSHLSCEYSMILTGAAFYHRFYHFAYTFLMDERIRERVDELKNCEDIAFNMLVAHLTRRPPVKVTVKWSFLCKECNNNNNNNNDNSNSTHVDVDDTRDGVPVSLRSGHYQKRTECLQYFVDVYGYNPLLYSQFRADSVLYKTRIPADRQKCFKLI